MGITCPNESYTLGFFHNSGNALLINKFSNYADILKLAYIETTERITDVENENIHCNHAVAGCFVGKSWKPPKHICESIANQLPCEIKKFVGNIKIIRDTL